MPVDLQTIVKTIQAAKTYAQENRLKSYRPYGHPDTFDREWLLSHGMMPEWSRSPWQLDFHAAGRDNPERMMRAANRSGKTFSAACEVAYHATGEYPDWWEGKRFDEPCLIWTGSKTNETSRDIVQKELFGGDKSLGTGAIPKSHIVGRPKTKQCGISGVYETVSVRHKKGISTVMLKTYEQGWQKWQGTAPHVIWMDEEPCKGEYPTVEDYKIFTEAQTRIMTSDGVIMITFTPLSGMTPLVEHFDEDITGVFLIGATWEDAPHLRQKDKDRLRESYPDHEVQARTMGIPMMGQGRIFTTSEEDIKCDPFEIPSHFPRICGIDFGIDHYFAAVWVAYDRDRDIIYVIDCWAAKGKQPADHAVAINKRPKVPVSWPHDGANREKGSGKPLFMQYCAEDVQMIGKSARYRKAPGDKDEKGGAQPQWPVIQECIDRMKTGRFKVFSTLDDWFKEFRSYHTREDNEGKTKVVSRNDDRLKATFYAVMMKRYAMVANPRIIPRRQQAPLRIGM